MSRSAAHRYPDTVQALTATLMADAACGWSMGTVGAVAEFWPGDAPASSSGPYGRVTRRGGIRLDLPDDVQVTAYETPVARGPRWQHGLVWHVSTNPGQPFGVDRLTEIGPDRQAINPRDRQAVLFDLGVAAIGRGARHVSFCIRTADEGLITRCRAHLGSSVFDPGSELLDHVRAAHPHRVVVTSVGRVEVYQPIGGPDTCNVSPEGPHTHLLPVLLRTHRTHDRRVPVPAGRTPCAHAHPETACPQGGFDRAAFEAFQILLNRYGDQQRMQTKRRVWNAVERGDPPAQAASTDRATVRVALRQMRAFSDRWQFRVKHLEVWERAVG